MISSKVMKLLIAFSLLAVYAVGYETLNSYCDKTLTIWVKPFPSGDKYYFATNKPMDWEDEGIHALYFKFLVDKDKRTDEKLVIYTDQGDFSIDFAQVDYDSRTTISGFLGTLHIKNITLYDSSYSSYTVCLRDKDILVGKGCNIAEVSEGSPKYKEPKSAANNPSQGTIIEGREPGVNYDVSWQYSNNWFKNKKVCRCKTWTAAFSLTKSDVWSDSQRTDLAPVSCPYPEISDSLSVGSVDVFSSVPEGRWFYFSAKELGNTTLSQEISSSIPSMRLCYRPPKTWQPILTPSQLIFFDQTLTVKLSWDETKYNPNRCDSNQNVKLLYSYGMERPTSVDNARSGVEVELGLTNEALDFSFILLMGTEEQNNPLVVTARDCMYLRERTIMSDHSSDDSLEWTISINVDWSGSCSDLAADALYEVVFNGYDEVKKETYSPAATYYSSTNLTRTLTYTPTGMFSNPSHHVTGSITVNLFYNKESRSLIKSEVKYHTFCHVTAPSFSDPSNTNIAIPSDTFCEAGEGTKTITINLPKMSNFGTTCDASTDEYSMSVIDNKGKSYPTKGTPVTATLNCPANGVKDSYNYTYILNNTHMTTNATSSAIKICTNENPKQPSGLLVDNDVANSDSHIITLSSTSFTLTWDFNGSDWGKCNDQPALQKFEIKVRMDGSETTYQPDENDRSCVIPVTFEAQKKNKTVSGTISAVRNNNVRSESNSFVFIACMRDKPSAPVLKEIPGVLSTDASPKFEWACSYLGSDCSGKPIEMTYTFYIWNKTYELIERDAKSGLSLDVSEYWGRYNWKVEACIKNEAELCRNSSNGRINVGECDPEDPSPSGDDSMLNPKERFVYVQNKTNAVVHLSWPTPIWGSVCANETINRTMILRVKDETVSYPDISSSLSYLTHELAVKDNGVYHWIVTALFKYGTNSRSSNTTDSEFELCLFTIPEYKPEVVEGTSIVVVESRTVYLKLVEQRVRMLCEAEFSVKMEGYYGDEKIPISKTWDHLGEEDLANDLSFSLSVDESSTGYYPFNAKLMTSLHGERRDDILSYELCIPSDPPKVKATWQILNIRSGRISANWSDMIEHIVRSGCGNNGYWFSYNVTTPSNVVSVSKTNEAGFVWDNMKTGSYSIDIFVWNGFKSETGISSKIHLCRAEKFDKVSLKSPVDDCHSWFNNTVFKFSKLQGSNQMCTELKYVLVLTRVSDGQKIKLELNPNTDMLRYTTALEHGERYKWVIERYTSQEAVEESLPAYFSACNIKPEVHELNLVYPIEGEHLTGDSELKFKWNITSKNDCSFKWEYTVKLWKDSDPSKILSYYCDEESMAMRQLDGIGSHNNGTKYWWNVRVANPETGVWKETEPESFTYCVCQAPEVPVASYPTSTIVLANGGYFISRAIDAGRSCDPTINITEPISYKAEITPLDGGSFSMTAESEYNKSTQIRDENGAIAIRIGRIPDDMPYGLYAWTVSATNNAGLTTTNDAVEFVVCDYPTGVDIVWPSEEASTDHVIVFQWNKTNLFFGYPCNRKIRLQHNLTLYMEAVNDTTNSSVVNYTKPLSSTMTEWDATEDLTNLKKIAYGRHYRWYIIASNGESEARSEEHNFYTNKMSCTFFECYNGGECIENASGFFCNCPDDYSGSHCEKAKSVNVGLIAGTTVGAFFIFAVIIGLIVFALIRKRRREARKRVTLKGPVKDLRFSNVKVPSEQESLLSSDEMEKLRERLRDDAENGGFALSMAILGSAPSANIENASKALLYAHHHDHNDVMLMKALIRHEVSTTLKPNIIFRANTAATLTFKHMSKMVGLNYLFTTLGKVVRDVIQKDADDAAVEERMKNDKNLSELMVMQDTFEVDPNKLVDEMDGQDDLLSINSIQLTLLVQRFMKHIFQSADKMPAELHEVMSELKKTVSSAYPEVVQNALSAFLFLRFFNCAIAVPESYGLLEEPPNERIRRSLVLATKVLTTMTSGAHFGEKEQFMTQFNGIIDKNQKELAAFYESVCNEVEGESSEFMDTPSDIYKNSMNVIAYYEKEANGQAPDNEEQSLLP